MPNEYCPKCKAIRNLRETITTKKPKDKKSKTKIVLIKSYHCEECNSFIKSEEIIDLEFGGSRLLYLKNICQILSI